MKCKLGLDNEEGKGGKYTGDGIAKMIGSIYRKLYADEHIPGDFNNQPNVGFRYSDIFIRGMQRQAEHRNKSGNDQGVIDLFTIQDDNFESINCLGFDSPSQGNNCKKCPYLQE